MQRAGQQHLFKVLPPKEIARVLTALGMTSALPQAVDEPTAEACGSMYQSLAEFGYDMELSQVKAQAQAAVPLQFPSIHEEAVDAITLMEFCKQLAKINGLEDFSWKDLWEPQAKRFRVLLSGLINFCRYKESQTLAIASLKEEVQELEEARRVQEEALRQAELALQQARDQHAEELPSRRAAQEAAQEARTALERLVKQQQTAERAKEAAEARLTAQKALLADRNKQVAWLQEQQEDLQNQIATSPEGLESEIQELQACMREKKAWVEEKAEERRARSQREQILAKVTASLETYLEVLETAANDGARQAAARGTTGKAQAERQAVQKVHDAVASEHSELDERVRKLQAEIEKETQMHKEKEGEMESRRQQAVKQLEEIMVQRTGEQKEYHALQAEKDGLESEIAAERRRLESEMYALLGKDCKGLEHCKDLEALLQEAGSVLKSSSAREPRTRPALMATGGYRINCSPSPGKHLRQSPVLTSSARQRSPLAALSTNNANADDIMPILPGAEKANVTPRKPRVL